jgi:hypothetical protein
MTRLVITPISDRQRTGDWVGREPVGSRILLLLSARQTKEMFIGAAAIEPLALNAARNRGSLRDDREAANS